MDQATVKLQRTIKRNNSQAIYSNKDVPDKRFESQDEGHLNEHDHKFYTHVIYKPTVIRRLNAMA